MQYSAPFYSNVSQIASPTFKLAGEGDITSILLPDGSINFYFAPVRPSYCNPSVPYYLNTNEVWFVRSINNMSPLTYFNNSQGHMLRNQYLPESIYQPDFHPFLHSNGYFQKFHNDSSTSTSDIHYFYPALRRNIKHDYDKLNISAAVQVDTPIQAPNIAPCPTCQKINHLDKTSKRDHLRIKSSDSKMSVDDMKYNSKRERHKHAKPKHRRRDDHSSCKCAQKQTTADKFVATCADQSSSCEAKNGCETQTTRSLNKKSDIYTEVWYPLKKRIRNRCPQNTESSSCDCESYFSECSSNSDE